MDETLKVHIVAAIQALEKIEVKGKENLKTLLAVIQHLDSLANGAFGNYIQEDKPES